ncbi:MAG: response regulator [Acidobacteriota bacterium]
MLDEKQMILVVEDYQNIRVTLTELLRLQGFDVITARDGDEGFSQAIQHQPDLVITDLNMPILDGVELARLIRREDGQLGNVPIIALSANLEAFHLPEKMNAGIDRFVDKSLGNTTSLMESVHTLLGQKTATVTLNIEV